MIFQPLGGARAAQRRCAIHFEEIVAAEAECCSFLDLALEERDGKLVLSVAAPEDGQAVADELASAFTEASA